MTNVVPGALRMAVAAVLVAIVGAGCSGHDEPTAKATASEAPAALAAQPDSGHNRQDVAFARRMLLYETQGIELAKTAASRAHRTEVRTFAASAARSSTEDLALIRTRLKVWKAPLTTAPADDADEEPGVLAADDVRGLASADDADFDWRFLTLLIEHHLGGVTLATQQEHDGQDAAMIALAGAMRRSQNAEIATMRTLLGNS